MLPGRQVVEPVADAPVEMRESVRQVRRQEGEGFSRTSIGFGPHGKDILIPFTQQPVLFPQVVCQMFVRLDPMLQIQRRKPHGESKRAWLERRVGQNMR